jgi:C4-dicarboxylate-specific signal transduction histidine kinase
LLQQVGKSEPSKQTHEPSDIVAKALRNPGLRIGASEAVSRCHSLPALACNDVGISSSFRISLRMCRSPFRDNGIGMEPEYLGRIFDVFHWLHPRIEYPGTGIRLAICKKILAVHGGRIWAESEPGEGSTCRFTLPAKTPG